jgi:uncharacterized protein (TIGR03437 family)
MGPVRACFGWALLVTALSAQDLPIVAGQAGKPGFGGDANSAASAQIALAKLSNLPCDPNQFEQTSHVSVDAKGNIYFADSNNQRIRRIDASGVITTVAGSGAAQNTCAASGPVRDGGSAVDGLLFNPSDVLVKDDGSLIIADQQNNRIRQVSSSGTITTIVGGLGHFPYSPNTPATSSGMDWPSSVALDRNGVLYFAELHTNRVGKLNPDGKLATVAGTGNPADLNKPAGIAIDPNGNVLIADTGNHRIRKATPDGSSLTTIAGTDADPHKPGFCGDGGPAAQACLNTPMDVKADAHGNIYIADTGNNRIRRIDPSGTITTVASDLNLPCAIAIDSIGNLVIVDWQNFVIRIKPAGIVNAASFQAPIAPGALFSIFGTDFAGATAAADRTPWPRSLGGVSVEVNGTAVPLFVVSPGQINAQLPYDVAPGAAGAVVVTTNSRSVPIPFTVAAPAPGMFLYPGTTRAIAANQDFSLNAPGNPESRGRALVFYVTGLGLTSPPVPTGEAAPSDVLSQIPPATISATVGGVPAQVLFAGLTPTFVGLGQVNLIVPDGAPTGDAVPVILQGSPAATVSIR